MRRAALLVLGLVVAGCGGDVERPALTGLVTTTTTLPSVDPLPARGIASDDGTAVSFWSLEGELLDDLPGLTLSSFSRPGGGIYVYRYEPPSTYSPTWEVRADGSLVEATGLVDGPEVWPGIAPPPGSVVGHWRWAVPNGSTSLAQWSGECEVPAAFFIGDDGSVRHVLGVEWSSAPNTTAMGWLPDGRALVDVAGEAACGSASPEPGRYAIDPATLAREPLDLPSGVLWG